MLISSNHTVGVPLTNSQAAPKAVLRYSSKREGGKEGGLTNWPNRTAGTPRAGSTRLHLSWITCISVDCHLIDIGISPAAWGIWCVCYVSLPARDSTQLAKYIIAGRLNPYHFHSTYRFPYPYRPFPAPRASRQVCDIQARCGHGKWRSCLDTNQA
jgi:hypothetical protein